MRNLSRVLLLSALLSLFPAQAQESDTITLFGTSIPGMFDDREPGPYNIIFDRLMAGVRADVIVTMLPSRRATKVFSSRGVDCMFLGSPNPLFYSAFGMKPEEIIHSDTIKVVALKIYGPAGRSPFEDSSILFRANFAVDVGIGDVSYLKDLIPFEREGVLFARTLVDGFKLLDQGRIEALVAIDLDVQSLNAKSSRYYERYSVSQTYELRRTEDVFVCRKFPRTERFISDINKRTIELQLAGLLDDVFAK